MASDSFGLVAFASGFRCGAGTIIDAAPVRGKHGAQPQHRKTHLRCSARSELWHVCSQAHPRALFLAKSLPSYARALSDCSRVSGSVLTPLASAEMNWSREVLH